ncbi:hypothetical protein HK102_001065 [Quaeritorhiza haematococci]|nr:hypothetical protein HK102_001065 [Quaeritorhiza haematococci]
MSGIKQPDCPPFDPTDLAGVWSWENDVFLTGHCVPSQSRFVLYFFVIIIMGGITLLGTGATIARVRRQPSFVKMLPFKILVAAIATSATFCLMYILLIFGSYAYLSPFLFGIGTELNITYLALSVYSVLSLIEGVNLNTEARTQVQNLSQTLKTATLLARVVAAIIDLILFSLASYFHAKQAFAPQILCLSLGFAVIAVNFAVFAYIHHWNGMQLVELLRNQVQRVMNMTQTQNTNGGSPVTPVAPSNKKQLPIITPIVTSEGKYPSAPYGDPQSRSGSDDGCSNASSHTEFIPTTTSPISPLQQRNAILERRMQAMEELAKKVDVGVRAGVNILIGSCVTLCGVVVWAGITYGSAEGMAWSSVILALGSAFFVAPGLLLSVWIHGLRFPTNSPPPTPSPVIPSGPHKPFNH